MRSARAAAVAAAFFALLFIWTAGGAHAAGPASSYTLPLTEAVAALPVAAEDRTGYDRETSFGGWIDADRDGCNTRAEVLLAEAVEPPTVTGRCKLTGGRWYSWYDDTYVTATDIDHAVPLAEAWDSGAKSWTKQRRVEYANYLGDDRHLVAVSQRSNRQKSDQDVSTWIVPANPSQRCRYLADQVAVKLSWGLSVDPAEEAAMRSIAAECPNAPITVNPAP
ncbi:HNH endonuclease family protein [Streptomyces sp. MC1]|uniref:HNH endonuclease family protein n=1 Tax=Streptomyces sp. MC1 TaxID=295105 RepID=UPI0027DB9D1A|nr:HNH endonuclease family protein [Streptomyces sp. MC1]